MGVGYRILHGNEKVGGGILGRCGGGRGRRGGGGEGRGGGGGDSSVGIDGTWCNLFSALRLSLSVDVFFFMWMI